ncbi:MAG TPA: YgdI/YgdR family lipoprotein [Verrucomicrobiae bacterium]|nr:YgdI/YgdR family lipoprotein [Verrucomicrobiae bacterium]
MKKSTLILLLSAVAMCGCARNYTIVTNNGSQIGALGKPRLNDDVYLYKDLQGRRNSIPAGRVREIAPSSMITGPATQFNPKPR